MGSLSSVLKQRRQELGLTLLQIAEMVGVTEATVQRWESGNIKNVRLEKVGKLAEILQVSPAALMGWAESPEEKQPASGQGAVSFRRGSYSTVSPASGRSESWDFGSDKSCVRAERITSPAMRIAASLSVLRLIKVSNSAS